MADDASSYPATVDTFTALPTNLGGGAFSHNDEHTKLRDAINKIETELQTDGGHRMYVYANTTARDADITPVSGSFCLVTDSNRLYYYSQSAWWYLSRQETGSKTGSTDASGNLTVTFTQTFTGTVRVFCQLIRSDTQQITIAAHSVTTSGFTARVHADNAVLASTSVTFDWIAIED